MKDLLLSLKRHGIGTRAQTEDDFFTLCDDLEFEVVRSRRRYSFCFTDPDEDIQAIVLPRKFPNQATKLIAMYHEVGHLLFHGGSEPEIAFLGRGCSKNELEANAVALIALIPLDDLLKGRFVPQTLDEMFILEQRRELFYVYGI